MVGAIVGGDVGGDVGAVEEAVAEAVAHGGVGDVALEDGGLCVGGQVHWEGSEAVL